MLISRIAIAVALLVGCKSASSGPSAPPRDAAPPDASPYSKDAYIPAEFKAGGERWRDPGVYIDGRPAGVLEWGELPIALKPTWVKVKANAPVRPHSDDPGWTWREDREYRFADYLRALGVDPAKVREVHAYGPKFSDSVVMTRADLTGPNADLLGFRFVQKVHGKPVPVALPGFRTPDKLTALTIYIEKKPPKLVRNVGFVLDGVVQKGVPYFGDPLRGGIRVYLDDRFAAYIKRQDLPVALAKAQPDGSLRWGLFEFLAGQGVDTSKIVEGYVIRDQRWQEKLTRAELEPTWFAASSQAKGEVTLGESQIKIQNLRLFTRTVAPEELPVIRPEEQW